MTALRVDDDGLRDRRSRPTGSARGVTQRRAGRRRARPRHPPPGGRVTPAGPTGASRADPRRGHRPPAASPPPMHRSDAVRRTSGPDRGAEAVRRVRAIGHRRSAARREPSVPSPDRGTDGGGSAPRPGTPHRLAAPADEPPRRCPTPGGRAGLPRPPRQRSAAAAVYTLPPVANPIESMPSTITPFGAPLPCYRRRRGRIGRGDLVGRGILRVRLEPRPLEILHEVRLAVLGDLDHLGADREAVDRRPALLLPPRQEWPADRLVRLGERPARADEQATATRPGADRDTHDLALTPDGAGLAEGIEHPRVAAVRERRAAAARRPEEVALPPVALEAEGLYRSTSETYQPSSRRGHPRRATPADGASGALRGAVPVEAGIPPLQGVW